MMDDKRRAEIRELIRIMNGELLAELFENERQVEAGQRAAPSFDKTFMDPNQMGQIPLRKRGPLERWIIAMHGLVAICRPPERHTSTAESNRLSMKIAIEQALGEMHENESGACRVIKMALSLELAEAVFGK